MSTVGLSLWPVPKPDVGYYDHAQEVSVFDGYRGIWTEVGKGCSKILI